MLVYPHVASIVCEADIATNTYNIKVTALEFSLPHKCGNAAFAKQRIILYFNIYTCMHIYIDA